MGTASAFGLEIDADRELSFLRGEAGVGDEARAVGTPAGRPLRLSLAPAAEPRWRPGRLISDERRPGGGVEFQIEEAADGGFEIRGPDYGACRIAAGAGAIWGRPGGGGIVAWQRLLVAQSLPFAAVLRGLEALHASAVVAGGAAVAFSGPSGTGKTSLALALARRGAPLLADDVLAVERRDGELLAHPGAAVAGVDHREVGRLRRAGLWDEPEVLGENRRELLVRTAPHRGPAPLAALFLLERRADGPPAPRFEPAADARLLLAQTFNLVLGSPVRLAGLLEICAELSRRRVERVRIGPGTGSEELAERILERLGDQP